MSHKRSGRQQRFAVAAVWICLLLIQLHAAGLKKTEAAEEPAVSAQGYCVMNAATGEVVCAKEENTQLHPASITKILTAWIAAESTVPLEQSVWMSEEALERIAPMSSTLSPIAKQQEKFTMADLMHGLIMKSGNECANQIALSVSGSVEAFVEQMNEKAVAAGALHTHFSNPHGLDEADHLTTPYDMALVTKEALKNEVVRELLSCQSYTIAQTAMTAPREMTSGHSMLNGEYPCEGVFAGKPGYTALAKWTLVTVASREENTLIVVVMGCDEGCSYQDTETLLEFAYARLRGEEPGAGSEVFHPQVISYEEGGFTVRWQVGEDAVRAVFPVWMEYNEAAGQTMEERAVEGSVLEYTVSLAEHGGAAGVYTVQAYVYDGEGKESISTIKVLTGPSSWAAGFLEWDGGVYYIRDNGALALNWLETEDGCYYFDYITARMQTGWVGSGVSALYLDADGALHTGWLTVDGQKYYCMKSGDLAVGIMRIDGFPYFFNEAGILKTGLLSATMAEYALQNRKETAAGQ